VVAEYTKNLTMWIEKDAKVQHMIANTLPNSLFIRLINKKSAFKYFTTLSALFEQRSIMVGTEMHRQLGKLKLKEGGVTRAHIDKIIASCEELASIGRPVSDNDLFNIIYASLPRSYNPGLASLSSIMRLQQKTITPDDLMDIVLEEYDRLTLQDGGKSKGKASSEDAAFGADAYRRGKHQKFLGNCHNCGWSGHKSGDCWEDGGGKAGQAPKGWKSRGKKSRKDSKDAKGSASAHMVDQPDCAWLASLDDEALLASDTANVPELYDSGVSQHLSPSHEHFINFISIPPKPIRGADNSTFNTIGKGDL
jgi:hypothetical protein